MQYYRPSLIQNQAIYLNTEATKSTMNYQNKGKFYFYEFKARHYSLYKKIIKDPKKNRSISYD